MHDIRTVIYSPPNREILTHVHSVSMNLAQMHTLISFLPYTLHEISRNYNVCTYVCSKLCYKIPLFVRV